MYYWRIFLQARLHSTYYWRKFVQAKNLTSTDSACTTFSLALFWWKLRTPCIFSQLRQFFSFMIRWNNFQDPYLRGKFTSLKGHLKKKVCRQWLKASLTEIFTTVLTKMGSQHGLSIFLSDHQSSPKVDRHLDGFRYSTIYASHNTVHSSDACART